jgi:cysteinyl-tRNA synthetase
MAMKYLGDQLDIHCGGIDHIPVHHTNEITQAEAALGNRWVNYWLHSEFLMMKKDRMSKSSGQFLTLAEVRKRGFSPTITAFFAWERTIAANCSLTGKRWRVHAPPEKPCGAAI